MKIDEAIKILTIHNDHNPNFTDTQRQKAHQLGIEALKRIKRLRDKRFPVMGEELPGED